MPPALRPDGENSRRRLPLMLRWGGASPPLPVHAIRAPVKGRAAPLPSVPTGPVNQPFDFSKWVHRLCADIVGRCPDLGHIDMSRVLIGVTQARSARLNGLQARLTPLRFPGGRLVRNRKGTHYQVQRYLVDSREILYLLTFCLPRFLDRDFDDKFVTLFHELYHISPAFDGSLRRYPGRCAIHVRGTRRYDEYMAQQARQYLADGADLSLHAFLRLNFAQLERRHGSVVGAVVPRPMTIPVAAGKAIERGS